MFLPLFTAVVVAHLPEKRGTKKNKKMENSFILLIFQRAKRAAFVDFFLCIFHCHSSTLSPSWHFLKKMRTGGVLTFWIIKWLIIVWLLLNALLYRSVAITASLLKWHEGVIFRLLLLLLLRCIKSLHPHIQMMMMMTTFFNSFNKRNNS